MNKKNKTVQFDQDKCSEMYEELVEVFKKYNPTVGEILIAYGNLGYTLGASIGGYKDKGPGSEELEKLYYSEPGRLDVALMLNGINTTSWFEQWSEKLTNGMISSSENNKEKEDN